MRAMILAAGRGQRMKDLTLNIPKPLLNVGSHYLIEYAIYQLKKAGIKEIVINVAYHQDKIIDALKDGSQYGVRLFFSRENERLETGGGIVNALPLLGEDPFIVVSCDIITDYNLANLPKEPKGLAHLVLVDNPVFHPNGDFGLQEEFITRDANPMRTFANIGIYRPEMFANQQANYFPLSQLLFPAIDQQQITGEYFSGQWYNIGTPEDLQFVNQHITLFKPLVC